MNRNIKFRVWSIKENKWMFGYDTPNLSCFSLIGEFGKYPLDRYFNNFIIMEWTGLNDKNGKEIYEGDIVKVYCQFEMPCDDKKDFEVISFEHIGVVNFENGSFIFKNYLPEPKLLELKKIFNDETLNTDITSLLSDYQRIEVLGNIYQNNEILTLIQ